MRSLNNNLSCNTETSMKNTLSKALQSKKLPCVKRHHLTSKREVMYSVN
jgi:hypothetical protein